MGFVFAEERCHQMSIDAWSERQPLFNAACRRRNEIRFPPPSLALNDPFGGAMTLAGPCSALTGHVLLLFFSRIVRCAGIGLGILPFPTAYAVVTRFQYIEFIVITFFGIVER
eukprot:444452-Pelagomonas_calceolata.AAC.6